MQGKTASKVLPSLSTFSWLYRVILLASSDIFSLVSHFMSKSFSSIFLPPTVLIIDTCQGKFWQKLRHKFNVSQSIKTKVLFLSNLKSSFSIFFIKRFGAELVRRAMFQVRFVQGCPF